MITILAISNPRATHSKALIDVDLATKEHGVIPCSLHPGDATAYRIGDDEVTNGSLFCRAESGDFGPINTALAK